MGAWVLGAEMTGGDEDEVEDGGEGLRDRFLRRMSIAAKWTMGAVIGGPHLDLWGFGTGAGG